MAPVWKLAIWLWSRSVMTLKVAVNSSWKMPMAEVSTPWASSHSWNSPKSLPAAANSLGRLPSSARL